MKEYEIHHFSMPGYNLAANYWRSKYLKGGVCILARKDIKYQTIDIKQYCRDKISEMCVVKLKLQSGKLILGCIYRAPSSNIHQFLDLLDDVLKCLHHSSVEFILCGDINVNYLTENKNKSKLNIIMNTYNLEQVVDFPTTIFKDKVSQLDDIFLDRTK
jgi:exonuclease III